MVDRSQIGCEMNLPLFLWSCAALPVGEPDSERWPRSAHTDVVLLVES